MPFGAKATTRPKSDVLIDSSWAIEATPRLTTTTIVMLSLRAYLIPTRSISPESPASLPTRSIVLFDERWSRVQKAGIENEVFGIDGHE
jgi:hypothetical protein